MNTQKYKVTNAGFDYHDQNGCCNGPEIKSDITYIPENTEGFLVGNWSEVFRTDKYKGSVGDGMPKKILKADDGNYYGLGYGYKLEEI